jgi:hypothetical protein
MHNVALFDAKYPSHFKSWRSTQPVTINGTTLVVEMDPEDLHLIDDFKAWASDANQRLTNRTISPTDTKYWGHIDSVDALHDALRYGWAEGTVKIQDLADKIRDQIPHPYGSRRKMRWSDQGDSIDMAKVYSGGLDRAWRSSPRQRERAPRVLSLDVDVGQNCMIGADDLFWSGAAAVALTDALEEAGYRVELFASSTSYFKADKHHMGIVRLRAKRAHERLNPALTAALVALPATFRWYHLHAWTKHPHYLGFGFGKSGTIGEPLEQAMLAGHIEGAEVTLQNALSEKAAVKEVTEALERLTQQEGSAQGTMQ